MTGNNQEMTERRAVPRQKINFPLRYQIAGKEDESPRMARTVDISSVSVLFKTSEDMPPGTSICAELLVPNTAEPVKVEGWINRIEWTEREKMFLYSLMFNHISNENREILAEYVNLIDVEKLMMMATERNASDIHLIAGRSPVFRVEGLLVPTEFPTLSSDDLRQMLLNMMTLKQRESFEKNMELDFSYASRNGVRFRVNVHVDRGNMSAALRLIPNKIRNLKELGLPWTVEEFARKGRGLFIVSGPTGSGKTTTLAAMIDEINRTRNCMVVSIEDPIEYLHESVKSIIKQREVGTDTLSFHSGLKHVLRQDPDVILIGEIRDLESISIAITAAETGHLVLTTLHTSSTAECINRIMDVYPAEQQQQIRSQLAGCLEGIVCQLLLPRIDGKARVLATEIMVATPAVRSVIREGKLSQVNTYLEAGSKYGMHTMDSSLANLVSRHLVDEELAKAYAKDPNMLSRGLVRNR